MRDTTGFYLYKFKGDRLSEEETASLLLKAQGGDKEAAERLLISNIGLVAFEAKKYIGLGLSMDDLLQEGSLGFIKAISMYKFSKDTKFSTYALYWIRSYIVRSVENNAGAFRIPVHAFEALLKYKKIMFERENAGLPPLDDEEAAKIIGVNRQILSDAKTAYREALPLDYHEGDDGEDMSLYHIIADKNAEDAFLEVENMETYEKIRAVATNVLDEKEWDVLCRRFGLKPYLSVQTYSEISEVYAVSRERIRQIEVKGIRKIRYVMRHKNTYFI